jgi:hypothetical protein
MQIRIVATMPLNFALFRNSIITCLSYPPWCHGFISDIKAAKIGRAEARKSGQEKK